MLVGYGVWCALQRLNEYPLKNLIRLSLVYVLLVFALRTVVRNRDWHSGLTIYSSGVKFNPRSGVMLVNLGSEYAEMNNHSYAELLFRTATQTSPQYSTGHFNLGRSLVKQQRFREAEEVSVM